MTTKTKIIVVEDELDILDLLTYELERNGYEVLVAKDGIQALRIFEEEQPDLVITDIVMPKMNGFIFIQEIIKLAPGIPIIAVSGAYGPKLDQMAPKLSLYSHFEKPFSVKDLVASTKSALNQKKPA